MENTDEMKKTHQGLKHLGFVRAAAINTIMWFSSVYDYAKQNSGPLKSAVGPVEGAVTTVVTPVFDKFKDVPDHLLAFLDQKVDVATAKLDEHAPPFAKHVAIKVHGVIERTTQMAKHVIHEAQVGGPFAAVQYAAKESKDLVLDQTVKVWSKLERVTPFRMVAEMTVPTAAHWSEKYNKLVTDMSGKGYSVFDYAPLIPLDVIAKAFKQGKAADGGDVADTSAGEVASQ